MRGRSWTGEWLQWGHRPRGSATSLGATVIALLVPSQRAWACFVRRAQRERIRPRIPNNNPTLRKKSGRWLTHMTQLPPALGCRSALLMSGRPTRSCSCWDRYFFRWIDQVDAHPTWGIITPAYFIPDDADPQLGLL